MPMNASVAGDIRLESAIESQSVVENLFQYYVYEMSRFVGISANTNGIFEFNNGDLNQYWHRDDHYPYLIRSEEELVGFVLLRKYPPNSQVYDVGQFFVLRRYSGLGFGQQSLQQAARMHPGNWLVRVMLENKKALGFWLAAITSLTGGCFSHTVEIDGDFPMHFIRFSCVNGI